MLEGKKINKEISGECEKELGGEEADRIVPKHDQKAGGGDCVAEKELLERKAKAEEREKITKSGE